MMNITEDAKARLHSLLMVRGGAEVSLRLIQSPSRGLGLVLDRQTSKDQVVEYRGEKVLLVSEDVVSQLNGMTIDIKREDGGCTLVINRS